MGEVVEYFIVVYYVVLVCFCWEIVVEIQVVDCDIGIGFEVLVNDIQIFFLGFGVEYFVFVVEEELCVIVDFGINFQYVFVVEVEFQCGQVFLMVGVVLKVKDVVKMLFCSWV